MAFRLPTFNLWGRAWTPNATGPFFADQEWIFMGYFRCQLRMIDQHYCHHFVLDVPKRLYFRHYQLTPFALGQRVQLAGWENMWAKVLYVQDVGAGFSNEHRCVECIHPLDTTWNHQSGLYMPAVDHTLQPPDGFLEMGVQNPADFWQDPNMTDGWEMPIGFGPEDDGL